MRGPIDYIVVGFEGNRFDGSVLRAIADAVDKGVIKLVALSLIQKDEEGTVSVADIASSGEEYVVQFIEKYQPDDQLISKDDTDEVADLLENNTSAGLLIVEQVWAIPLKQALIDANGVLVAEGRIHPDAAAELNQTKEN